MNALAAVVTATVLSGACFIISGTRMLRPDPLRRALRYHPAGEPAEPNVVDRTLLKWNKWMGIGRQQSCLQILNRSPLAHRSAQIRAALVATVGVSALTLARFDPIRAVCASTLALVMGLLLTEKSLHRAAQRQRRVLADQVLVLAEFLALCLTAGVTPAEALERSAPRAPRPLAGWVETVVRKVRAGRPLDEGLTEVGGVLQLREFERLADSLRTAAERGVPVAEAVGRQVRDDRGRRRATELERAGRADMAMLVPVVLLILPAVVVVAVYPGFVTLLNM